METVNSVRPLGSSETGSDAQGEPSRCDGTVTPPGEAGPSVRLTYQQAYACLMREFGPVSWATDLLIDALALDFVQLARALRMVELLSRPWQDQAARRRVEHTRVVLKLIEAVRAGWGEPAPRPLSPTQARMVAEYVAERLQEAEADLKARTDPQTMPLTDAEYKLRLSQDQLMFGLGKTRLAHIHASMVIGLLKGTARRSMRQERNLHTILDFAATMARRWLDVNQGAELTAAMQEDMDLAPMALDPDGILLLRVRAQRLQENIRRKLVQLRGIRTTSPVLAAAVKAAEAAEFRADGPVEPRRGP